MLLAVSALSAVFLVSFAYYADSPTSPLRQANRRVESHRAPLHLPISVLVPYPLDLFSLHRSSTFRVIIVATCTSMISLLSCFIHVLGISDLGGSDDNHA